MSQRNRRKSGRRASPTRKQNRTPLIAGGIAVAVILGLAIVFSLNRSVGSATGERIPDQGASLHMNSPDDPLPVPYNSNPPTSGYHWGGGIAPWGVQTRPLSDTISLHNLEHGGVIIHYREGLEQATIDQLAALTRELQARNPCIILEPRPADRIDNPIVVSAWNYLLRLDTYDAETIRSFFRSRVGRGPEAVCSPSA